MSSNFNSILQQCNSLSTDEQLELIQVLAEKLKTKFPQASQPRNHSTTSNHQGSKKKPYQPKDAKDWINHIR
ncbi:MAG: hypothetical protein AAGD25_37565 [Cyanobacteria bacterium P01_F01_bin.150]